MLLAGVLAPGLVFAFAPPSFISRSIAWTPWGFALPSGDVLRQALHSCQFVRFSHREFTLCPQRLRYRDFPKHLVDALVASEDRDFFEHGGINKGSIAHAALANLARSVRERRLVVRRGGSTITQQLARTLFLDERQGIGRKIEELALAPRIEAVLNKQQILAGYMNVVPHARGMNGFDAAARHYFGVPVGSIDVAEAAMLVGMLPAPNDRDPVRHPQAALDATLRVLERMNDQKVLGDAALKKAEQEVTARIHNRNLRRGRTAMLREETRPYRDLAVAEATERGALTSQDYRLITNMEPNLQARVVDATRRIAGRHQAAGVFIRPTGEVLGIAGSRDYVESSLNRAFQSRQPIGSTGKLFVLIAAHENGDDAKRHYPEKPIRNGGWPAEPNRQCRGDKTLVAAFADSCNRPFAWAARELGDKLTRVVDRFDLKAPDAPVLVPLGGIEATPLMLARSYAAVANEGGLPRVRAVIASLSHAGSVLYAPEPYAERVMSERTAQAMMRALRDPVRFGTARHAASKYAAVYGKTGTTNGDHDALFVGMTKDFVGAFWVGNDDNTGMRGVAGSGAPARAFAWVTDGYYADGVAKPITASAAGPTGRWNFTLMQNRDHRYYALVAFAVLLIATYWWRLHRGVLGWALRTRFGMRAPARAIGALLRQLARARARRRQQPLRPSV
jgi:penicillin-binding protein 1A